MVIGATGSIGAASLGLDQRLVIDATGELHGQGFMPEKSWYNLDPVRMAQSFAVNAIGPALLMKHFLPLLPRQGKAALVSLSAKVGSMGGNRLGGWYSDRASKAALNQWVHTAAIELRRSHSHAFCVVLHPGAIESNLSLPFVKFGIIIKTPQEGAVSLLTTINLLSESDSGEFFNQFGDILPW